MQPGEMIWFLVGIGTGLVLAMLGFALMALLDSRRLHRDQGSRQNRPDDQPRRVTLPSLDDPLPDVPPEPVPVARKHAAAARLKRSETADSDLDQMMSSLAAELERMQASEATRVTMELPDTVAPMGAMPASMEVRLVPSVTDDGSTDHSQLVLPPRPADAPLTPMRAAMTKAMESRRSAPREPTSVGPSVGAMPTERSATSNGAPAVASKPEVVIPTSSVSPVRPSEPLPPPIGNPPNEPATSAPVERAGGEEHEAAVQDRQADATDVAPAKPKIPPLPRVAPARKFAPALPPRQPPAGSKPN